MQKFLFLALLAFVFSSCETDIDNPKGKFEREAMVIIRGQSPVQSEMQKAKVAGLTPLEVVHQARNMKWTSNWAGNWHYDNPQYISRVVSEGLKDFELPAIKMFSTDIIDWLPQPGIYFIKDFIYGRDVVITDSNNDTIAFVPDSLIINARELIEPAFNDSNYTEVYRLFNEAFTFYPIQ